MVPNEVIGVAQLGQGSETDPAECTAHLSYLSDNFVAEAHPVDADTAGLYPWVNIWQDAEGAQGADPALFECIKAQGIEYLQEVDAYQSGTAAVTLSEWLLADGTTCDDCPELRVNVQLGNLNCGISVPDESNFDLDGFVGGCIKEYETYS